MTKIKFALLLQQAIEDYAECTEDDERSDVVQQLIEKLEEVK